MPVFSVAGTRTGFAGKSGLFTEAVRIIREMRSATNNEKPKIVLFENVVGLLSSGKGSYAGSDYRTVLSAFTESEIPMPRSGRWANAGMVRGRGFSLAWIVKDAAKHYRVAQRRRRLFAVVDFTGQRAGEILFEPKSLSGYFAARGREGQGTSADTESGVRCEGGGDGGVSAYGETGRGYWQDGVQTIRAQVENHPSHPSNAVVGAFMAGQARNARSIAYSEAVSPTLKGSPSGLNQVPCVCEPQIARTLTARGDGSPNADGGPNIIAFAQNQRNEVRDLGETADCLAAEPGTKQQTYIAQPRCMTPWDTQQARIHDPDGTAPTLAGADGGGGRNPAGLVVTEAHPAVAGTLCASGAGMSRPAGMGSETDLCIAYCLQGNMIGRKDGNGPQGGGVNEEISFTVSAADRHAVAAVDCRNLYENIELSGTLQSKNTGGYALNSQNPVRIGYVIRRLTPMECELLMSLPRGWTEYGHDGKLMSDSARYQMCGNSIVVNVLAYIMQNIAARLRGEDE
jgi:DNA (cytosine-5)-methyltransferase 1